MTKSVFDETPSKKDEKVTAKEAKPTEVKKDTTPAPATPSKVPLPMSEQEMVVQKLVKVNSQAAFLKSGGTEEQFTREASFAIQMMRANPYLMKMEPQSIVDAIVNVALTGLTLNPELRLGYLVPRKGKLYFTSSYMGKCEILRNTGVVKEIYSGLVKEGDVFNIEKGSDSFLKHTPDPFGSKDRKIKGGYWFAVLQDGTKMFDTMTADEINSIRERSEAVKSGKQSPWDTDPEEMMKKTLINRAFKSLPKSGISNDMLKVIEVETQVDKDNFEEWKKNQEISNGHFDDDFIDDAEIVQ